MKQAEVIAAFNSGKIITVATFLHFKKEVVAYRGKDGKPATFDKIEYSVLTANGIAFVQPDTRRIPGFEMDKFQCPFKPNDRVVVEISTMTADKGIVTIGGIVHPLD